MSAERRARTERRERDYGPPNGWRDRRKHAERRLTTAEEAELSAEEFAMYFGTLAKVMPNTDYQLDQAAEVFDRVRDGY